MEEENIDIDSVELAMAEMYQAHVDSIESTLTFYSDTSLMIGGDMALLTIPEDYMYVGPKDGRTVLEEMWGNPPSPTDGLGK
ncbi:MAG: DUF2167 domain-containing protein [Bacteroidota bacterium]